ncbi:MAG: ABC transporter ATP-binding protein [Defluviitaleaceae bacterium]|nr:ABC transporter ATP-binding protein [Defluviitaleaceae bacterium]
MSIIQVKNLTKDFGRGRGVFDVSFAVEKGEVFGFLGPNGAGKTTTIRHLMGFSQPQAGKTSILSKDCWSQHHRIKDHVGYLPGEISLPDHLTGAGFIKQMAGFRKIKDLSYANKLTEWFSLDTSIRLKRMSLGTKRKLAIVTAFLHDPDVLLLDEPTGGLDPLMQDKFIQFVKEEKKRGKTILLSSHIFSEVDATCDRIAIIKEGKLVSAFAADELRHNARKEWKVEFVSLEELEAFSQKGFEISLIKKEANQVHVIFNDKDANRFLAELANHKVNFFSEIKFTLEDYFMKFYRKEGEIC